MISISYVFEETMDPKKVGAAFLAKAKKVKGEKREKIKSAYGNFLRRQIEKPNTGTRKALIKVAALRS